VTLPASAGPIAPTTGGDEIRPLPPAPSKLWRIIGPGVVASGVGLSSGEFVLWPYIASQVGLVFLWGAILGVVTQFFINMEIERYTLATGETALAGFNRIWRHAGPVFVLLVCFGNLWPGWAMSAATLCTYVFGGSARVIAIVGLLVIGAGLTLAPVVYEALERLVFVKVAAVLVLIVLAVALVIRADTWTALAAGAAHTGQFPGALDFSLLLGAIAFAGAGGGQNLCQSNWIRDKGFGMGQYVPRLVSPLTGEETNAARAPRYRFEPTPEHMERWRGWWRLANAEQALAFAAVTVLTIAMTSMLAHTLLHGRGDLPNGIAFLGLEGRALQELVGPWFGILFWLVGALSLFTAAMGIVDYTSRLAADVLTAGGRRKPAVSESRMYFRIVWALVLSGVTVLAAGIDQPLVLLVIAACVGGTTMSVYSALLIVLNRRHLVPALRIGWIRLAVLAWSALFYGYLAVLTILQESRRLFG
jgi:hypothetical protein